ncbi:MAG: hypothetical protein LBE89_00360 [Helicobacteraceae bacterium]|jgi:tetratricopeptide (TPR) repeat protein|nr:hypothetical protein [Helicobacteraceae bacterium]
MRGIKRTIFLTLILAISSCAEFNSDLYRIMALDAEGRLDFNASARFNMILYKNTSERTYSEKWIESLIRARQYDQAVVETKKLLKTDNSRILKRHLIIAYFGKNDLKNALANATELAKNSKTPEDYALAADIYMASGNNKKALAYYKRAYSITHDSLSIDKIALILSEHMNDYKEAAAYMETHLIMYGSEDYLLSRLASVYAKAGNIKGVVSSYKRIYRSRPDAALGQRIVELSLIQDDYKNLMEWLEETHFNNEILLELYKHEQLYKKGSLLALKLYKKDGDVAHLAVYAMLQYEAGDQNDPKLIQKTISTLERVVAQNSNHIHLNYLGYLLIDHSIDVKRGVELVKLAVQKEPNNIFYNDSLAWGYYRLGEYGKAYDLMNKFKDMIKSDPAIFEHYKLIEKSYKNSREANR